MNTYGFIVAVEAEGEINPEFVSNKLIEGVMWVEGTNRVCADFLGKLDVYPDEVEEKEL